MYKPAPMLPTREELISVRRAEARALLKAAYQLQSNTTATAPNRIIGAANDLIGALHIVGRQDAINNIMRIMHSVEDWSAAHQHELMFGMVWRAWLSFSSWSPVFASAVFSASGSRFAGHRGRAPRLGRLKLRRDGPHTQADWWTAASFKRGIGHQTISYRMQCRLRNCAYANAGS
jgi:hypothetical protein